MGFEPVPEEETEEEQKARLDGVAARKLEAYKKLKAKPGDEAQEAADLAKVAEKATGLLGAQLSSNEERIHSAESEIELIKTRWLMDNHLKMNHDKYDEINRCLSIYDIELGARDIVLRLDLDIPMSPFIEPPKVQEVASITNKS